MSDLLLKYTSADNYTQITAIPLPIGKAGDAQTATKYFVQNVGDRDSLTETLEIDPVGSNDGSAMLRIGLDTATVMPPYGLGYTLTAAGDGGAWGTPQTVYYVLTATNALGQTVASIELPVVIDVATKRAILTWPLITGATGYKLYRSATAGTYGASTLCATIASGATLTYTDDGSACGSGTPPAANTTGGAGPAYGTPPTLGTAPLTLGVLKMGQWACFWANRVIPTGTPGGDRRLATLAFIEV